MAGPTWVDTLKTDPYPLNGRTIQKIKSTNVFGRSDALSIHLAQCTLPTCYGMQIEFSYTSLHGSFSRCGGYGGSDAKIMKQGTTLSPNVGSSGNYCVILNLFGADGMRGSSLFILLRLSWGGIYTHVLCRFGMDCFFSTKFCAGPSHCGVFSATYLYINDVLILGRPKLP